MREVPTGATAEFGNHNVTVAEEVDVESDVRCGLLLEVSFERYKQDCLEYTDISGNVNLRDIRGQEAGNFGNRCHLHGCSNDTDQIYTVSIMLNETTVELVWQVFAEENDVGLTKQSANTMDERSLV